MFEVAELGLTLEKAAYKEREPQLRQALLDAQDSLKGSKTSVVILIAGVDGSGKGDTLNMLVDWMDARGVEVHAMDHPTEEEIERPRFFRYWRTMPPAGRIAIYYGSWYTDPVVNHTFGKIDEPTFEKQLREIVDFERMLVDEGTLVLKYWLHVTKQQQKKSFKNLESRPETSWRVTPRDWKLHESYDRFLEVGSRAVRMTSTGEAPWEIIDAHDRRYRHVTVAEKTALAIQRKVAAPQPPACAPLPAPVPDPVNLINSLDLETTRVAKPDYTRQLAELQAQVGRYSRRLERLKRSVALVFEGSDAAGKGGAIRRIAHALDARFYQVIPIAAPTDEEKARPYLWRFWRRLPRWGRYSIYDRSWYGRVLVERIENFCRPVDWQRAYSEINAFEEQLVSSGIIVLKFWLAISADEQLRRFQEREATGYKHYKITPDDWRNREKWPAYEAAVCDMIEKTSTEIAPWTLVEAEDKNYARLKVLRTLVAKLQAEVGGKGKGGENGKPG